MKRKGRRESVENDRNKMAEQNRGRGQGRYKRDGVQGREMCTWPLTGSDGLRVIKAYLMRGSGNQPNDPVGHREEALHFQQNKKPIASRFSSSKAKHVSLAPSQTTNRRGRGATGPD